MNGVTLEDVADNLSIIVTVAAFVLLCMKKISWRSLAALAALALAVDLSTDFIWQRDEVGSAATDAGLFAYWVWAWFDSGKKETSETNPEQSAK